MKISNSSPFLNEEIIKTLEKNLGFNFPKGYESFLLEFNGGFVEDMFFRFKNSSEKGSVLVSLNGITYKEGLDLLYEIKFYGTRYPSNMIPVGDDVYGNRILLSVKGPDYGKVYFWDHERETEPADYSNLTLIADSFEEFIQNLKSPEEVGLEE